MQLEKYLDKHKQNKMHPLDDIVLDTKCKLVVDKDTYSWNKFIAKALKRLEAFSQIYFFLTKGKTKFTVYIYDWASFTPCEHIKDGAISRTYGEDSNCLHWDGEPVWCDVQIKIPYIYTALDFETLTDRELLKSFIKEFFKLYHSKWILDIVTKEVYDNDKKEAIEDGCWNDAKEDPYYIVIDEDHLTPAILERETDKWLRKYCPDLKNFQVIFKEDR